MPLINSGPTPGLKSQEYSAPVLGLIFLRFAEVRFAAQRLRLEGTAASSRRGSRVDDPAAYHAEGVLYLTPNARYDQLLALPNPWESARGCFAEGEDPPARAIGFLMSLYQRRLASSTFRDAPLAGEPRAAPRRRPEARAGHPVRQANERGR